MPWTQTLTEAKRTELLAAVDKQGSDHLTYANGDKEFAGFLLTADAIASKRLGFSIFDLPDACWADYYQDGMKPGEALRVVLENGV